MFARKETVLKSFLATCAISLIVWLLRSLYGDAEDKNLTTVSLASRTVIANASLEWYNSNCLINHVPVNHTSSTYLNGNIGLEFVGRMGNNMIQYMHARLHAYHRGSGIIEVSNGQSNSVFGKDIKDFSTVVWVQAEGETIRSNSLCGGKFAQYYLYLMRHRDFAKCLFSPRFRSWYPKRGLRLKSGDVVIHVRDPKQDGEGGPATLSVPLEYYVSAMMHLNNTQVYIIAAPALHQGELVQSLCKLFSAEIYEDIPSGDFSLAVMAPTFIGSFGTFTWMAAYLHEGQAVHLPYISNLEQGARWVPWQHLFIHDDARVTYHDIADPYHITRETAREVVSRKTEFARAVRERKNPCPQLD